MGEGVTNPVRGAASSSPAAADPVSSLLLHVDSSIQLILLLTVVSAVAFRWIFRSRKGSEEPPSNTPKDTEQSDETLGIITNDIDCSDREIPGQFLADVDEESNSCSDRKDVLNSEITKCPSTGFCSKSEPRLRRSVGDRQIVFPLQSYAQSPDLLVPILLYNVARCATRRLPGFRMDSSDTPSVPDPQTPSSDSFFTWDSGGSSGEYSFVHTAVELPKYPDGAITEEERQMLLLYMQTGHPELLLTPSQSGHQNGGVQMSENALCDPVAVRGFLETIVEENSDDLRSPSECDETSLGWGSWDESDEDRLTVVEMVTSTTNDFASGDSVHVSVDDFLNNGVLSEQGKLELCTGEGVFQEGRQSVDKDELCEYKDKEIPSRLLSGVKTVNNSSRNVPTFENDSYMDNTISSTQKCEKDSENSSVHNKPSKMDFGSEPGVSSNLNSLNNNGCFDNLWITQNTLDSPSETLNPWTTIDFKEHCEDNNVLTSLDISNPEQIIEGVNPLLVLGSDDICLVPSNFNSRIESETENLMFSDNFKDYFLPAENYTPAFNKNVPDLLADFLSDDQSDSLTEKPLRCLRIGFGSTITEERSIPSLDASKESHDVDALNDFINGSNCFSTEKSLNNPGNSSLNEDTVRCLRIGFDDESPREEYLFPNAANAPFFNESESLNIFNMEGQSEIQNPNVQEAMFSPLDGDIVYGSTWASSRGLKEPEKTSSGTEVHCSAAQVDVRCEPTILSDSPPPDNNNRPSSDDDITEVPNSLSRWRHHTDLQHLQEATSPITRWQHHSSLLQFFPEGCKQTTDSEESDDGLPPQLKEIYSSFKMRDNKMGRIRIKEDKNNNFKRLGLWEKESKVTLPPFNSAQSSSSMSSPIPIQKEPNSVSKEELDDLEFDMFAVDKNPVSQNNVKIAVHGDSDIDDALRSFNHLDDYSSESEDNSGSENCYVVNFREKKENDMSEIFEIAEEDSIGSSIEDKQLPSSGEMLSLENPCSDNSDNCPLCTDPSFKNSHINDLFSLQNSETLENDVQTLLQKTYPKMVRLSQSNLSDAEVIESNGESNKTGDSISPITTSDSDEGVRVKEVKKRVKKRSKENSSTELKHDDSGYVEDDEDEDDDSLGENSEKLSSGSQMLSTDATNQTRKSLSTAFYESKSNKIEHADSNLPPYAIPETFQEFSKQLELSLSNEEIKAGFMNEERWNIPENLSQFSAWLLDKELKKISNRDEMEKLLVDDMMSLREQTIAKFLKNSLTPDEKLNLKSQDLPSHSDISASVENIPINTSNIEIQPVALNLDFAVNKNDKNINLDVKETEGESLSFVNEDNFTKDAQDSENELPEEYYSYNFNTQVSKIFEGNGTNVDNKTDETSKEQSLSHSDDKNKLNYVSPTIIESDASFQQSMTAVDTNETKFQITNIEAEITHHLETAISPCNEYNLEYNSSADLCIESSEVEPPENTAQQSNPPHPSITSVPPSASENTGEIQPKVNDTTIRKEEEKALPEVVNSPQVSPSTESIPVENVNIDDSTGEVSEVATSVGRKCNLPGVDTEGVDRDLMTQGVPPGEKGACVGPRADAISTPEAEVVSADLDGETHVHFNACHAYSSDSRPSDNSDLCVSGAQDIAPELTEKDFGNWSVVSDSEIVSGSDKVVSGSEEVGCCLPAIVASPPTQEEDSVRERRGFTTVDYADSPADCVILKEDTASNDDREGLLERDISNVEVGGLSLSNDSELFICDKTLVTHHIDSIEHFETKEENSDLNDSKEILDLTENGTNSKKPDLIPSDEISQEFETNIPVYRGDYQRSNSLGRDSGEADETFELWNGQSKSTPDLRRCHEQQKKTNAPLSVRLSKSVSQRIEDYLGRNSRDGRLSKSLPPNERSRHYRRICVSTETVVEKAARFEARSKSNCAVTELSEDRSSFSKRSGSCPPSSMRSNTSWISDRSYRNYNKPTATVRPTVDMHRNGMAYKNDLKDCNGGTQNEKENIHELITGYTKASKVTHKPPVPPSTTNLQQSLKSARLKGKIANARKDFFERLSQQDLSEVPKRDGSLEDDASTPDSSGLRRFDEFRRSAREERARLAASHPDLGALEAAVRSSKRKIDQLKKRNRTTTKSGSQSPLEAGLPPMPSGSSATKDLRLPYRRATGEIAWASCAKRVEEAAAAAKRSKGKLAHEQLEIVDGQRAFTEKPAELRAHPPSDHPADPAIADGGNCDFLGTRARSMDFLLDADNRERAQPPENRLGGPGGQTRVKSEHELRIERSLQNLTVPDWYKQSAWSKKPTEGFILRRGSEGSAGESRKRWQGLSSSRTPSTTSLNPPSYSSQRSIVVPKRVTPGGGDWRYAGSLVSSRESLTPASPASLSPRECASAAFQYGLGSSLSRWSSSRLSTSSAPLTALNVHRSFRQPYLGWRAAAASSSGGGSRSSPGTSPVNATTPVMQGSRPESPRRGSQEHHYVYGLQQNQITSAATLRPESAEQPSDSNRISPLALNTTNIFFTSNVDDQLAQQHPQRFGGPEMRRDRYSYTQSLYSGTVIVSPLEDSTDDRRNFNIYEEEDVPSSNRFRIVSSPQPPRVWMESSFVGTKKDGSNEPQVPPPRTIRIIPSDSAGVRTDRFGTVPGASAGASAIRGGTCATQTAMGLQSAASLHLNGDQRPNLVDYDSEPKAYPRVSWRRSSSSSKDVSPDNSSTDNELWLSVGEDMVGPHKGFRTTPERHMDGSSRSSVSPPSPPLRYPQPQKRVSEDSTGSQRPIFFSSSRRGSKGSNPDNSKNESSGYLQNPASPTAAAAEVRTSSRDELSRKSSSVHSGETGGIRRDSRSGGSNSWRDSRTDQESSSATTSRGEKDSKSSASMEEVLESLLAIPPTSSRSSSPTSPRRSKGPSYYQSHHRYAPRLSQEIHSTPPDVILCQKSDQLNMMDPITRPTEMISHGATFSLGQRRTDEGDEGIGDDTDDQQGKMFDGSFSFPQPYPSSNSSAKQLPISSPLGEVNHGSFCRSSSTSPLEDDVQSPTSMEVLVPEGEEQELSSIIEGRGPSTTTGDEQQQGGSTTPMRKKKTSNLISTTEGHLKCHRPKCTKSLPVEEARAKFRTCPNCYTYYCSRQCRKLHLARHKDHCPQTRISNLCKQVLMKARDDPVSRRHLSLCAKRGLLSRGRGAVKLLFLNPEDALDYLVHGWESAKGQTLYVSRSDLLPQEMGSDVFSQVRSFCDKYNPERKFILLAAITVTNEIAAALEREVVVRGAKMHLSPSLPEDDVQTLILTITKTDPETGDPKQTTVEERRCGLNVVEEQLSTRGVDLEKLYPHTYRKLLKYVVENEPFSPISIFPMDQRNGRVFMCIILPWADPDIIVNISSKGGAATGKSSKKKWIS